MKNRVTVLIAKQEYTLVAAEELSYLQKIASHVDAKIQEVLDASKVSIVDGAVLAAVNIADEYFKEVETAENLRRQVKECLEESTKLKLELSEAKREIFKLQNRKPQNRPQGRPQGKAPAGKPQTPPQGPGPVQAQQSPGGAPDKPQEPERPAPQLQPPPAQEGQA